MEDCDWLSELKLEEEPTSSSQRRALYRLGLQPHFVRRHVRTKEQASELIGRMLGVNGTCRPKVKKSNEAIV